MKIDRKFYETFTEEVRHTPEAQKIIDELDVEKMERYLQEQVFNKPEKYYNIQKIEESLGMDRKITLREVALNILGLLTGYKSRKEKLYDEFENFKLLTKEDLEKYSGRDVKNIEQAFSAYITDENVRRIVYSGNYSQLFNTAMKGVLLEIRDIRLRNKPVLEYIKDYVSENNINCDNFRRI